MAPPRLNWQATRRENRHARRKQQTPRTDRGCVVKQSDLLTRCGWSYSQIDFVTRRQGAERVFRSGRACYRMR